MFHALWLLCALGATVFATASTRRLGPSASALGFVIATVLISGRGPDAVLVGGLASVVAVFQLVRPARAELVTAAGTGALAAIWAWLLRVEGSPLAAGLLIAVALPLASGYLTARRPRFAPPVIREEAFLVVVAVGAIVAMAPGVVQGWQSALALNLVDKSGASAARAVIPTWAVGFGALSMVVGGVYRLWRRG